MARVARPNVWRTQKGPSASELNAVLTPDESITDQLKQVHGNLNPNLVTSILREAEYGRPARYVDLVLNIRRRDGHIHDCLQLRERGVQMLKVAVVPKPSLKNAKRPNRRRIQAAEAIANELSEALGEAKDFSTPRAAMQGDSLLFGRAYQELVWKLKGSHLWPERFITVHPRRFVFRENDSRLLFDPTGNQNWIEGRDLESYTPGKFVGFFPRINGDTLIREGIGELVCWLGMFRNWGMRDMLQTAESAWKPRRKGVYHKDASPQDKSGLIRALKHISQNGACVIPDTTEIEELWSMSRAKGEHNLLLTWFGREFTKATLGYSDAIEPSDTGSSKVDADIRSVLKEGIVEGDALLQSAVWSEKLAGPFTFMNYGDEADAPLILLLTQDVKDVGKFAEVVETLQRTGLPIAQNDVYDKTGFRKPEPGEAVLTSPMWEGEDEEEGDESGGQNTEGDQNKPSSEGSGQTQQKEDE